MIEASHLVAALIGALATTAASRRFSRQRSLAPAKSADGQVVDAPTAGGLALARTAAGGAVESTASAAARAGTPEAEAAPPDIADVRFHERFERNPALLQCIDATGTLLTVSDGWLARFGYARDEVVGHKIFEFLAPEFREVARDVNIPRLFLAGRVAGISYQMMTRSGRPVDVLLSCVLLGRRPGHPPEAVSVVEDVILQRKTEQALNETRRRMEAIVGHLDVATWELDLRTRMLTLDSPRSSPIGAMPGQGGRMHLDKLLELIHPDDIDSVRTALDDCISGRLSLCECEYRRRNAQGEWRWIHVRGRMMTVPSADSPAVLFGIAHDVSQQHREMSALRETAGLLSAGSQLARIGGWDYDPATGAVRWTPETARLHGVPVEHQPTLAEALSHFGVVARRALQDAIDDAVARGQRWDLELPLVRSDGRTVWVRSLGEPVMEQGVAIRVAGTFQDIGAVVSERETLRAQNARFALAAGRLGLAIWEYELAHRTLHADARLGRLLGLPGDQAAHHLEDWFGAADPVDAPRLRAAFADACAGRRPLDVRFVVQWPDGSVHRLRSAAEAECDENGQVVRLIGAHWDAS